jgi:hypothetical protein
MESMDPHPNTPDIDIGGALPHGTQANLRKLVAAKNSANRMLNKMKQVIESPTLPQHRAIIQASFGPQHENNKIRETIQGIRSATIRARVHPLVPSTSPADTRFMEHPENNPKVPDSV